MSGPGRASECACHKQHGITHPYQLCELCHCHEQQATSGAVIGATSSHEKGAAGAKKRLFISGGLGRCTGGARDRAGSPVARWVPPRKRRYKSWAAHESWAGGGRIAAQL